jgi:hypothetical protein
MKGAIRSGKHDDVRREALRASAHANGASRREQTPQRSEERSEARNRSGLGLSCWSQWYSRLLSLN